MKRTRRIGAIPEGYAAFESEAIDFTKPEKDIKQSIGKLTVKDVSIETISEELVES